MSSNPSWEIEERLEGQSMLTLPLCYDGVGVVLCSHCKVPFLRCEGKDVFLAQVSMTTVQVPGTPPVLH